MHSFGDTDFFIFESFIASLSVLWYKSSIKKCKAFDEEHQKEYDESRDEVLTKETSLKVKIFLVNIISIFLLAMLALFFHPEYTHKWEKQFTEKKYSHIVSNEQFDATLIQDDGDTLKGSLSLENKAIYEIDVLKSKWGDNLVNVKYLTKNNEKYDAKNELIMITNSNFEKLTDLIDAKYVDEEKQRLKSLIK